jgi:drug/metabolite transporter (DMT)-like permease
MWTPLFALTASLSWGVSDFLGGLSTRSIPVYRVLLVSQPAGLLLILLAALLWGRGLPAGSSAWLAAGAGVASIVALGFLYAAMAKGSMIVVAPLASTGAVIPVVLGIVRGEPLSAAEIAGIALAATGTAAATWQPGSATRKPAALAGAVLALASAAGTGASFTLLSYASEGNPLGAVAVLRLTSCAVAVAVFASRRRQVRRDERAAAGPAGAAARTYLALAGIGVTDAIAEFCFAAASSGGGQLSIVSALAAMYPAVTVILAATILRERTHPIQALGAAGAVTGVVLLAFGMG